MTWEHLDETGQPCTRHPASPEAIAQLAALGSRVSGFNHDIASKIQGVMMAIDEITELASSPELQRAAETAHTALGELNQLLQANRALAKPPVPVPIELGELVSRAATRVGVTVRGELAGTVCVAVPLTTQAIALAIDVAAGLERRRSLAITSRVDSARIELALPFAPTLATEAGTSLGIASAILQGALRCEPSRLVVWLPTA